MAPKNSLKITGVSENNLKAVDVEIPHNQLVVVTGLSGSGKSSLAFDTIYAEGQRRYIETFSTYVRQFLERIKQPKLTSISNVRPAIAIEQHARIVNARATVGSLSDVSDYLRLLFANLAELRCKTCGIDIQISNASKIAERLSWKVKNNPDEVFLIAAPILSSSEDLQGNIERLQALGFSRVFTGDQVLRLEEIKATSDLAIQRGTNKEIVVVIDRVRADTSDEQLLESTKQALNVSDGKVLLINYRSKSRHLCVVGQNSENHQKSKFPYSEYLVRPDCEELSDIPRPAPSLFSSNHPYGACPGCKGFGAILIPDPQKIVSDGRLSIEDGAIHCWSGEAASTERRRLKAFCEAREIPLDTPWEKLSSLQQQEILLSAGKGYIGPVPWLKRLERKIYKMHVRVFLSKYRSEVTCTECGGGKLRREALCYHIQGKTISDLMGMPLSTLSAWVEEQYTSKLSQAKLSKELSEVFSTLRARLKYLNDLQLSYLSLNRQARTLSGGEVQRVRLATALGSELVSTQFVLDEPSIGLHPRDTDKLIEAIKALASRGNSVLVVEHDEECIRQADHVLALGPGAGKSGGEVVFSGRGDKFKQPQMPDVVKGSRPKLKSSLKIRNASARNLKSISFDIPLNRLVCLTGVSGSGKSTIVSEVIQSAWERYTNGYPAEALDEGKNVVGSILGFQNIHSFEVIDQSALAKSPRANIATYAGLWDRVRALLAMTDGAASRRLSASNFSFNTKGGRCPACEGAGRIKEEMQFLSDVYLPCEICGGKRFGPEVLEVTLKGLNVAELLSLTVDELQELFPNERTIKNTCSVLSKLGLGHLSIGHSLSDLSGGEAQRLKLVPYIAKSAAGSEAGALLIFDEPTTGLHTLDIHKLLQVFEELLALGHTVLCVEHNLAVIEHADHIIDIGPEGGSEGGQIVCTGTPLEVSKCSASYTGRYLNRKLKPKHSSPVSIGKSADELVIKGAREHNLKDIDVSVPLNDFVAITGVSGSGKSTLAKDIIFAEGQRRYLDCLSPYARQFIQELGKPDIDEITGVMPTVYVGQHMTQPSRYSTVGTLSEIYNFLRLMYAKVGVQYCHEHPEERISAQDPDEMAESLKEFAGKRIRVLVRILNQRKGSHVELFEKAISDGITEVRVDGVFAPTSSFLEGLARNKSHTIDLVTSHFNPANFGPAELKEVVSQAISRGEGSFIVYDGADHTFSIDRACKVCKRGFFKPDPEDFSFSSGRGRCEDCNGLGVTESGELCQACGGQRLGPIGRSVKVKNLTISQLCELSVFDMSKLISNIKLNARQSAVISGVTGEIAARLSTLIEIGLKHLGMNQLCSNLSSGELNRLRLAAALGSPLSGVMYVLDEPSAGLHPNDNRLVLGKIAQIAQNKNSVLMIEHDEESILAANHVIEVGPGGGRQGGTITYNGSARRYKFPIVEEVASSPREYTTKEMRVKCAKFNNLKNIDVKIPLNQLVTFVGVSGAGKSSLLYGVIGSAISDGSRTSTKIKNDRAEILLSEPIKNIVVIDHKPIGKNSRSTPVSYLEIWDDIRKVFAGSLEAKAKGYGQNFFSFNTGTGRCQSCMGQGTIDLEMGFLAEARVTCETCRGLRFGEEAQTIRYKGLNISQVLALTFEEARGVFANHRRIHRPIHLACELGLGYLTLGQSSTTLSGGEAQRIKLASELANEKQDPTLYLLDEPTTGLHRSDVTKLVRALKSLVDKGHSVYVIEHDPIVIKASDHIIELGPGPGVYGGQVIFNGRLSGLTNANTPWGKVLSSAPSEPIAGNL
jgi:excinuclease ABC subunit A